MALAFGFDDFGHRGEGLRWRVQDTLEQAQLAVSGLAHGLGFEEGARVSGPAPRWRALLVVSAAAICPAVVGVGYFAVAPYVMPRSVADRYVVADERAQALELRDSEGEWLGVFPTAMRVGAPGGSPAYLTLDGAVPDDWYRILVALEDRNLGTWRSVNGVDVVSVYRSIPSAVTGGAGGSSLSQMLVRCMRHLDPSAGSRLDRLGRKFVELLEAPALYHRLGGASAPMFRSYLARHLPLVQGGAGSRMGEPLHGIGLASQVLWGVEPDQLSLAQQAVLAAAVRRQVILVGDQDPQAAAARDARWRIIVARAIRGLQLAYPGSPRAAAAIMELRQMPSPWAHPHPPGVLTADGGTGIQAAANPEARALASARDALILAQGQMLNRLGPVETAKVAEVRLTLSVRANARFRTEIERHTAQAQGDLKGRLAAPLLSAGGRPGADIVAVAVRDGRVIGYYSNSSEPLFDGAFAERDDQFRFQPAKALRPTGSIAKAPLAVEFGKTDAPNSRYCNERVANEAIHNSDGSSGLPCTDSRAWVDVATTFGESLNLPLVWRLRATAKNDLEAAVVRYRLRVPPGASPRAALPLGLTTARPADLLTMMQAIQAGAAHVPAHAAEPTVVEAYRRKGETRWRTFPAGITLDLSPEFASPGVAAYVRTALGAPLAGGGSLAGVGSGFQADGHIAKSGTSSAGNLVNARDKYAIGAYRAQGHAYGYLVLLGSRDPQVGLGQHVGWRPLWPLVRYTAAYPLSIAAKGGS